MKEQQPSSENLLPEWIFILRELVKENTLVFSAIERLLHQGGIKIDGKYAAQDHVVQTVKLGDSNVYIAGFQKRFAEMTLNMYQQNRVDDFVEIDPKVFKKLIKNVWVPEQKKRPYLYRIPHGTTKESGRVSTNYSVTLSNQGKIIRFFSATERNSDIGQANEKTKLLDSRLNYSEKSSIHFNSIDGEVSDSRVIDLQGDPSIYIDIQATYGAKVRKLEKIVLTYLDGDPLQNGFFGVTYSPNKENAALPWEGTLITTDKSYPLPVPDEAHLEGGEVVLRFRFDNLPDMYPKTITLRYPVRFDGVPKNFSHAEPLVTEYANLPAKRL